LERFYPGKLTAAGEERIQTATPSCADSPSIPSRKLPSQGPRFPTCCNRADRSSLDFAERVRLELEVTVLRIDFLLNHGLNQESGHA
jgi:hypothetical protein